ncbi:hypothetical protein AV530_000548 [Patagioenas fasciata monilis]|uniref:Uncharacterized protein n=1 Tax=Patagioenas fasciata monilis TaxID=372326 RepID=A0A1V4IFL6_PATFA|nr:hypothetical protein AV530_000548 [Patagioenas fasciata monilis]
MLPGNRPPRRGRGAPAQPTSPAPPLSRVPVKNRNVPWSKVDAKNSIVIAERQCLKSTVAADSAYFP